MQKKFSTLVGVKTKNKTYGYQQVKNPKKC